MSATPTQRSLKLMRERGYYAEVVERWVPVVRIRRDFAGVIDILALGDACVVGVQATSYSNTSARVRKIVEHENWPILQRAGIKVLVHGWRKVKNRWEVREVEL
jgi:hypothetical protein